ncbi:hypothetical protein ABIC89_004509 [Variovorax boronicumulans]|uniref:hypothetical protein n=1 Tax=Variovorax boronicumulans TaxID=436515 RepID=UPI003391D5DD
MNRTLRAFSICLVALIGLTTLGWYVWRTEQRVTQLENEAHPLVDIMGNYLRFSEKIYWAGDAGNWELADWYSWKLTKAMWPVKEGRVPEYADVKDYNVGMLTAQMLEPAVASLNKAIKAQDTDLFRVRYQELMSTCNACHQATQHGYIQVAPPEQVGSLGQRFPPLKRN